jgi:hypothetical protein
MKIRNYLFIKACEALFVIVILILCLAFKSRAEITSSKLFDFGMVLQPDHDFTTLKTGTVTLIDNSNNTMITIEDYWKVSFLAEGKVSVEFFSDEENKTRFLVPEVKPDGVNANNFDDYQPQQCICRAKISMNKTVDSQLFVIKR